MASCNIPPQTINYAEILATLAEIQLHLKDLTSSRREEELTATDMVESKVVKADEVDLEVVEADLLMPEGDSPPKLEPSVPNDISEQVAKVDETEEEAGQADLPLSWSDRHKMTSTASDEDLVTDDGASIHTRPPPKPPEEKRLRLYKSVKNYLDIYFQKYQVGDKYYKVISAVSSSVVGVAKFRIDGVVVARFGSISDEDVSFIPPSFINVKFVRPPAKSLNDFTEAYLGVYWMRITLRSKNLFWFQSRDCMGLDEDYEWQMGSSSRVYKLHGVSVCQAYDLEHPDFDVIISDDIEMQEDETLFQKSNGSLADDDMSSNPEKKIMLVFGEEDQLTEAPCNAKFGHLAYFVTNIETIREVLLPGGRMELLDKLQKSIETLIAPAKITGMQIKNESIDATIGYGFDVRGNVEKDVKYLEDFSAFDEHPKGDLNKKSVVIKNFISNEDFDGGDQPKILKDTINMADMTQILRRRGVVGKFVKFPFQEKEGEFKHGSVAIAAITSCTNASNLNVKFGAGLVAIDARNLGLQVKPWIKTYIDQNDGLQFSVARIAVYKIGGEFGCYEVEFLAAFDDVINDGANLVISIVGKLLQNAEEMIRMGLHPREIISGYSKSIKKAIEILEELVEKDSDKMDVRNREEVILRMITAVASKQFGQENILCPLIADACIQVCLKNPSNFNVYNGRIAKLLGRGLHDSTIVRGMLLKSEAVGSIKTMEKAEVAAFVSGVDTSATETKGTVLIHNAEQLEIYVETEEAKVEELIKAVVDSGAKVLISGVAVVKMARHFCEHYKLMVLKISSKPGGVRATSVRNEEGGNSVCTIVLQENTDSSLDDIERVVDGVNIYKAMCRDSCPVAGVAMTDIGEMNYADESELKDDECFHNVTIIVSVENTDIGITFEAQGRIFTPFIHADYSTLRNYGGTGISLSISKCLTELRGGQISFKDQPHVGSTFSSTSLFDRCNYNTVGDLTKPIDMFFQFSQPRPPEEHSCFDDTMSGFSGLNLEGKVDFEGKVLIRVVKGWLNGCAP